MRGFLRALRHAAAAKPLVAAVGLVAVAGVAAAAITYLYSTNSTLSTSVVAAPVQFQAGDDAGPSALSTAVTAYSISTNKTYFTATVKGIPEGSLVIDSFAKLANVDSASRAVSISTTQVSNAFVTAYTVEILNATNVSKGTLTLTDASPSVTVTIPATETYHAKLTLTLATGAGANNVALSNGLTISLT